MQACDESIIYPTACGSHPPPSIYPSPSKAWRCFQASKHREHFPHNSIHSDSDAHNNVYVRSQQSACQHDDIEHTNKHPHRIEIRYFLDLWSPYDFSTLGVTQSYNTVLILVFDSEIQYFMNTALYSTLFKLRVEDMHSSFYSNKLYLFECLDSFVIMSHSRFVIVQLYLWVFR